jgi:hypothetical protein
MVQRPRKGLERAFLRCTAQLHTAFEYRCKSLTSSLRILFHSIKVKIIHASWVRDKTWPVGMQAPESDEEQQPEDPSPPLVVDTLSAPVSSSQPAPFPIYTSSEVLETMPPPSIDRFR